MCQWTWTFITTVRFRSKCADCRGGLLLPAPCPDFHPCRIMHGVLSVVLANMRNGCPSLIDLLEKMACTPPSTCRALAFSRKHPLTPSPACRANEEPQMAYWESISSSVLRALDAPVHRKMLRPPGDLLSGCLFRCTRFLQLYSSGRAERAVISMAVGRPSPTLLIWRDLGAGSFALRCSAF